MQVELSSKAVKTCLVAFLGFGALAYGCMFVTYILWFMGFVN